MMRIRMNNELYFVKNIEIIKCDRFQKTVQVMNF